MGDYHDRLREHERRQREFAPEYARTHGLTGAKAGANPPENKALAGPPENKAIESEPPSAPVEPVKVDLSGKSKAELRNLAEARGIDVTRTDGRTDLEPRVADYLAALGG